MSDASAKDAWVQRVLGIAVGSAGSRKEADPNADVLDLNDRMRSAGLALRSLRDAGMPQATDLVARYAALIQAAKTDPLAAAASLDLLEGDVARATSAARAKEAPSAKGRGVAYRVLLLRWRDAQTTFDANLKAVGTTLLARPDIQADPRIEEIKQAVAGLPRLVPVFGGQLEDVLDAGMNAVDPAEVARLTKEGIAAIDAYRQQLAAASHLVELEEFSARDLGASLPLQGILDEALTELKQQLAG